MSFLEHNPFSTLQMITMLIFQVTFSFIFLRVLLARYACLNCIVLFYVFLIFLKGSLTRTVFWFFHSILCKSSGRQPPRWPSSCFPPLGVHGLLYVHPLIYLHPLESLASKPWQMATSRGCVTKDCDFHLKANPFSLSHWLWWSQVRCGRDPRSRELSTISIQRPARKQGPHSRGPQGTESCQWARKWSEQWLLPQSRPPLRAVQCQAAPCVQPCEIETKLRNECCFELLNFEVILRKSG